MRSLGLVLALAVGAPARPGASQEPPACTAKGAPAPEWFGEPTAPPPGTYQAEARSGGCPDAETAQKVAARTAAWRLAHAASQLVVFSETRAERREVLVGGTRQPSEVAQVLERVLAAKILERSWTYRQETVWTDTLAEHFLIIRTDTAAVREIAGDALATVLRDDLVPGAGVGSGVALSPEPLTWIELPGTGPVPAERDSGSSGARPQDRSAKREALSRTPTTCGWLTCGERYRRVVLAWRGTLPADGRVTTTSLTAGPQEATLGLKLAAAQTGTSVVLGTQYVREEGRTFSLTSAAGTLELRHPERVRGLVLVGGRGAVYAGYEYTWLAARRPELEMVSEQGQSVGLVGLGFPPFTEWPGSHVPNLYFEAAVVPRLQALRAGVRSELIALPGMTLAAVLGAAGELTRVGRPWELVPEVAPSAREPMLMRRAFVGDAGVELRFLRALGVTALGRFTVERLELVGAPDLRYYGLVFRPLAPVSATVRAVRWDIGVRLTL